MVVKGMVVVVKGMVAKGMIANSIFCTCGVHVCMRILEGGWSPQPTISKTKMNIRATSLGVTTFDFPKYVRVCVWYMMCDA